MLTEPPSSWWGVEGDSFLVASSGSFVLFCTLVVVRLPDHFRGKTSPMPSCSVQGVLSGTG